MKNLTIEFMRQDQHAAIITRLITNTDAMHCTGQWGKDRSAGRSPDIDAQVQTSGRTISIEDTAACIHLTVLSVSADAVISASLPQHLLDPRTETTKVLIDIRREVGTLSGQVHCQTTGTPMPVW